MNSLDFEAKGNEMFIAICLDDRYGGVNWVVAVDEHANDLKNDMINEGYNLNHSFIVRIPIPNVESVKRDASAIKVKEIKDLDIPLAS